MASVNQKLIVDVFNGIELRPDCRIIVISNPLDAMVTWISSYFEHRLCVIGTGTLLDSWRLKFIIAQHFRLDPERIEAVVLGEHGDSLVPIWSKTTVDGLPIQELFSQPQLDELKVKLLSVAKEIRETENATKYGVAAAALHLMAGLLSKEEVITIASFPSQSILSNKNRISYGQFVVLKEGICWRLNDDSLNEEEKTALSLSIEKIRSITYSDY
jgi:malate/lactate dehydrogenase